MLAKAEMRVPRKREKFKNEVDASRKEQRILKLRQNVSTPPASLHASETPWGIGDQLNPVSKALLEEHMLKSKEAGSRFVYDAHERWCAANGDALPEIEDSELLDVQAGEATCKEKYGLGRCGCEMDAQVKLDMDSHAEILNSIASANRGDHSLLLCLEALNIAADVEEPSISIIHVRHIISCYAILFP